MLSLNRKLALIPASLPLFLLAGCSPPQISIESRSENGHLRVTMSQDWGVIFSDRKTPCVEEVALLPGNSLTDPIWKIHVPNGSDCRPLGSFVVGQAPGDFETGIALPKAAKGSYTLVIRGIGWGEAKVLL